VKSFLATQVFDAGRHCEAYRKRALANGGGLGQESPGFMHRALTDALKWTELTAALDLVRTSITLPMLETLHEHATCEAERTLYTLTIRDLHRWRAYGEAHIAYHVERRPERRGQLSYGILRADQSMSGDLAVDKPLRDALIIILARGERRATGEERLRALRERQWQSYLAALERSGVPDHRGLAERQLAPALFKSV